MAIGREAGGHTARWPREGRGLAAERMATGTDAGGDTPPVARRADSVEVMATQAPSESTPQRLAAIREQLKLLADYL